MTPLNDPGGGRGQVAGQQLRLAPRRAPNGVDPDHLPGPGGQRERVGCGRVVDDEKEQRPRRRADGYERPLLAAEDPAGRTGNEPVQLGGGDPFGGGRLARGLDRDPRTVRCAHGRGVVGDEVGDLTENPVRISGRSALSSRATTSSCPPGSTAARAVRSRCARGVA